jgi:hypothetical protein
MSERTQRSIWVVESREKFSTGRWSLWRLYRSSGIPENRQEAFDIAANLNGGSTNVQYRVWQYGPVRP